MSLIHTAARKLAEFLPGTPEYQGMLSALGSPPPAAVIDMAANLIEMNGGRPLASDQVTTDQALEAVYDFLGRFVAYPSEHAQIAHSLWILHAHTIEAAESTPRLAFLSPEPGSGKTRALEISETLVPRPVEAVNATPAYLFRKVSDPHGLPTILFDEIDTIFGARAKDHEEIRGVLNAGHRRGAMAGRCVVKGKTVTTEELPAFAPVALAGLGNLPDTILSRSIVIKMRRRAPTERVEAYRRRIHAPEGYAIRHRLTAWAKSAIPMLTNAYPEMPENVTDRAADVWESLLAISDLAGGDWPNRARVTAVTLVTDSIRATPSLGVRLLSDLRDIFGDREAISTNDIISRLTEIDDAPWGDMKGKPITPRKLANYLKQYDVHRKPVRLGVAVVKGYSREDLHDAWARYLPEDSKQVVGVAGMDAVTSVTQGTDCHKCGGEGCGWCQ